MGIDTGLRSKNRSRKSHRPGAIKLTYFLDLLENIGDESLKG